MSIFDLIYSGEQEEIETLLQKKKVDVNQKSEFGDTPLHIASSIGDLLIVQLLLKYGANSELLDESGRKPIEVAEFYNHKQIKKMLSLWQISHNTKGKSDVRQAYNELHKAITNDEDERAKELILFYNVDLNEKARNGQTVAHSVARLGKIDILRLLISKGANIHSKTNDGRNPLHFAVLNGNNEVIRLLIDNGANIDEPKRDGNTPLHIAASNGMTDTTVLLIKEFGSSPFRLNNDGDHPLDLAIRNGHKETVIELRKLGCPTHLNPEIKELEVTRFEITFVILSHTTKPKRM